MQPLVAPTASEIAFKCCSDIIWVSVFISGLVLFYGLQKAGERAYHRLLTKRQKIDIDKVTFGSYCQSFVHATLILIGSVHAIIHYIHSPTINAGDRYPDIMLYGIISILSASYYAVMFVFEFYLPQSTGLLIVMLIHHVVCGVGQAPIYIFGGSAAVFGAMCFQCEISNLALHISWFSAGFENQWLYRIAGICTLITFPVTRLLVLPYTFYMTFSWLGGIAPDAYIWCAISGEIFIFLMSLCYSINMWQNRTDWLELKLKSEPHED